MFLTGILHSHLSKVVLGILILPKLFKMEKEGTRKISKNFLLQSHKTVQCSHDLWTLSLGAMLIFSLTRSFKIRSFEIVFLLLSRPSDKSKTAGNTASDSVQEMVFSLSQC